ncbi:MAG: FecR family protein [Bacteroidetes bacterium]|nr:FecR family protein [Bacteroidota bacterium]
MKKNNSNNINWNFIAKYLSDETSETDNEVFEMWLKDEDNMKIFNNIKTSWKLMDKSQRMKDINTENAWDKLHAKIDIDEEDLSIKPNFSIKKFMRYAALFIILIGFSFSGYLLYNSPLNPILYNSIEAANNELNKKVILPDGSSVYLYADSRINFPKEFSKNNRKVQLTGEAFFEIVKNTKKPFIVSAKNARVKVLGTSFSVNANLPNKKVEVFVKTGKVKFYKKNNEQANVILKPGNLGIFSNNEISKKQNNNINYLSWKTNDLIFKNNKLEDVISEINKTYNVEILCETSVIRNLRMTSTFSNQPIDNVLEVICSTFDLNYMIKDTKEIVLTKNNKDSN